jgi:UDP-N-acetylglucosamine 2-epimerase (non-hydrolysing)
MAPIVLALRQKNWVDCQVLATAQHRDLLDQAMEFFQIQADYDFNLMTENQSLAQLNAKLLINCDDLLDKVLPDLVVVQGDTTTVQAVAMASFYRKIPVAHVEAGLRSGDLNNPFPEEYNRRVVSKSASWHFAPTQSARANLIAEGVLDASIVVTGNTVIDALLWATKKLPKLQKLPNQAKKILVTLHRRENFGEPLQQILNAIVKIALTNPSVQLTFPVHPNPNVKQAVTTALANLSNVRLCAPLGYSDFVQEMQESYFVLTDSGGVQEEAPALGKPVLVLRAETERPEAVQMGVVKLVGADEQVIVTTAQQLLDDPVFYQSMAKGVSPYGDGLAAQRIVDFLERKYH